MGIWRRATSKAEQAQSDELGALLSAHVAGLRRYARLLVGGGAEADDLVQECLARACAQTRPWTEISDPRAYLFTILHNVHISRRRRAAPIELPLESAPPMAIPATQQERLEIRDLSRALARLPEEQRQVVLLVGLEGMSYRDVADVLEIPVGTVMSRLSRGREALRRLMAGDSAAPVRLVK